MFSSIAFKTLSAVETDPRASHQHEFNGSKALLALFGPSGPQRIPTEFVWMPEDGAFVRHRSLLTWYDARARHPTRSEYRLYYKANEVTARAKAGDFLLICARPDDAALVLLAPGSGRAAAKIAWLFGIEAAPGAAFAALTLDPAERRAIEAVVPLARGDADEWAAEHNTAGDSHDPAIRASLLLLQQDLGRDREQQTTGEWAPEA